MYFAFQLFICTMNHDRDTNGAGKYVEVNLTKRAYAQKSDSVNKGGRGTEWSMKASCGMEDHDNPNIIKSLTPELTLTLKLT